MKFSKKAAIKCAEDVVASRHICGGCSSDSKCKVYSRFALMRYREALEGPRPLTDKQERRRIEYTINRLEKRLES